VPSDLRVFGLLHSALADFELSPYEIYNGASEAFFFFFFFFIIIFILLFRLVEVSALTRNLISDDLKESL
jgi:hypothetical protein